MMVSELSIEAGILIFAGFSLLCLACTVWYQRAGRDM
jgi:hypothetical protein